MGRCVIRRNGWRSYPIKISQEDGCGAPCPAPVTCFHLRFFVDPKIVYQS